MMQQPMPCLAHSAPTGVINSVFQPCQHGFLGCCPARRRPAFLMRKKVELARQGFKVLGMQAHSASHARAASGHRSNDLSGRHSGSDPLNGQRRHGTSAYASNPPTWEQKRVRNRDWEEQSRTQQSQFSSQALKQRTITAARAPNHPDVAYARAHPAESAQPSLTWAPSGSSQNLTRSPVHVSGHSSQRPASLIRSTSTQPSPAAIEEAKENALREDDLHSAALSHLSSLQVKIAIANTLATAVKRV